MFGMNQKRKSGKDLSTIIEELRRQLVNLVQQKGLDHIEVVMLSQHLDEYIVQWQSSVNPK